MRSRLHAVTARSGRGTTIVPTLVAPDLLACARPGLQHRFPVARDRGGVCFLVERYRDEL